MGNYAVPDEIRSMKPSGTIVKRIRGGYYVYSHSQHKDPETGKWKVEEQKPPVLYLAYIVQENAGGCRLSANGRRNK